MPRPLIRGDAPMVLHRPSAPEGGTSAGVIFRETGENDSMSTKAPRDGVYTLNGARFHVQAGDELPEGAVMDEERKLPSAPENKSRKAAPENRGKGRK